MYSIAFVPPLLQRKDPVQSCFHSKYIDMDKPTCYFEKIIKQRFIICKVSETDQIVAFMTFIDNYKCKEMLDIGASNYITTLCVQKENRRKGILKKMYEYTAGMDSEEKPLFGTFRPDDPEEFIL